MAIFPTFFFLGNVRQENVFYDIVERRNAFLSDKNEKFKRSKNWRFCKGVNPWFWSKKIDIFPTFFFRQNRPLKCLTATKKRLSRLKIQEVKKSRKIDLFPKGLTLGFGPKWPFFQLFSLGNIGEENVFYDILIGKNAFLGYKNKKFKNSKNWHFPKEVNPWFWSKNGHFSNFIFLGNIGQENVFYDILKGKNPLLGYKNKKMKQFKSWHFSKGVNPWFRSKNGKFSNIFFFRSYSPGECLLRYSTTKKRLSRV